MGASLGDLTGENILARFVFDQIRNGIGPARVRDYSSGRGGRNGADCGTVHGKGIVSALWSSEAAGEGPAAAFFTPRKLGSTPLRAGVRNAQVAVPVLRPQLLAAVSGDSAAPARDRAVSA